MRDVAIIGVSMTRFGKLTQGINELSVMAAEQVFQDSGVKKQEIGAIYLGNFTGEVLTGQALIGAMASKGIGIDGIPVTKVEGACASGGIALRHAALSIASGNVDFAVAIGVEKMSSASTAKVTEALAAAMDQETDGVSGLTFPGFFGLVFNRYLKEFNEHEESIHEVVIKSRKNAKNNQLCYLRKPLTMNDITESYPIAEPLYLMDCCPISDGAASVLLCPAEMAHHYSQQPIKILACEQSSGPTRISDVTSLMSFPATIKAARAAYSQAGIKPEQVDVVELHDCFSIAEVIDSEDLGFFPKGKGAKAAAEGRTAVDGDRPINPSGGLLSRGHPVGATGLAQVYELVQQLRGSAINQVKGAQVGLAHNLGGTGATCTVTILEST